MFSNKNLFLDITIPYNLLICENISKFYKRTDSQDNLQNA